MIKGLYYLFQPIHAWERWQMFHSLLVVLCFNFQPNLLPVSMINKQSGRDVLEHILSLSFPPPSVTSTNPDWISIWNRRCSLQLLWCSYMSHPGLQGGGWGGQAGRRQGETRCRREQRYGNSTLRLHFWKTDLRGYFRRNEIFRTQRYDCLLSSSRYNPGLCVKMENASLYRVIALETMTSVFPCDDAYLL